MFRRILPVLILAAGCDYQQPDGYKYFSLEELERHTEHLPYFSYVGSNERYHYFTTEEGSRYKIDLSKWKLTTPCPLGQCREVLITMRGGKILPADPNAVRDRFRWDSSALEGEQGPHGGTALACGLESAAPKHG